MPRRPARPPRGRLRARPSAPPRSGRARSSPRPQVVALPDPRLVHDGLVVVADEPGSARPGSGPASGPARASPRRQHAELAALRVGQHGPRTRPPGRYRAGRPPPRSAPGPRPRDPRPDTAPRPGECRFLTVFGSADPQQLQVTAPAHAVTATNRPSSTAAGPRPAAASAQNPATAAGSAQSATTAATGPVSGRPGRGSSTQNSLPSGSASTVQGTSPCPMSAGAAPRASSRSTSAAWCAADRVARSRCTRFLPVFGSGTGTNTSGSAAGPGSGNRAGRRPTSSGSSAATSQPSAAAQNRASRAGSAASTTRCTRRVGMLSSTPASARSSPSSRDLSVTADGKVALGLASIEPPRAHVARARVNQREEAGDQPAAVHVGAERSVRLPPLCQHAYRAVGRLARPCDRIGTQSPGGRRSHRGVLADHPASPPRSVAAAPPSAARPRGRPRPARRWCARRPARRPPRAAPSRSGSLAYTVTRDTPAWAATAAMLAAPCWLSNSAAASRMAATLRSAAARRWSAAWLVIARFPSEHVPQCTATLAPRRAGRRDSPWRTPVPHGLH